MDHAEAVQAKAAERYLLNELTGPERDAFEEHYFCCSECAEDIKAGAGLLDNAREVVREEVRQSAAVRAGWLNWLRPAYALAAIAILAAVTGYQNLVTIPRLRDNAPTPQALTSYSFITQGARSEGRAEIAADPRSPLGLYFDIPAHGQFASYVCQVQTESGQTVFSVPISGESARDTVQLLVPASTFRAGRYVLVVRGQGQPAGREPAAGEVARFPFLFRSCSK
jgi:hypothetical protein